MLVVKCEGFGVGGEVKDVRTEMKKRWRRLVKDLVV